MKQVQFNTTDNLKSIHEETSNDGYNNIITKQFVAFDVDSNETLFMHRNTCEPSGLNSPRPH